MPRFLKGTTDHDSDGKMGGSMKETAMTTTKKPAARKKLPAVEAAKDAAAEKFAEADAKADPDAQALADLQVERSIRGW